MTTPAIPMPAGAVPAAGATPAAVPATPAPVAGAPVPMPAGASADASQPDPSQTGELINDVGNKVFVPKDGEDYIDTVKRAKAYYGSMSPADRQSAIDKEMATAPKKAAQTMGAAAGIGVVGPSLLASPLEVHGALTAGFKALVPALTAGVVGVGQWAAEHPTAAKAIFETLKAIVAGTVAGKIAKTAGKVINASGE